MMREPKEVIIARIRELHRTGRLEAGHKPPSYRQMEAKFRHHKVLGDNLGDHRTFKPEKWPVGAIYVPILGKVFEAQENAPAARCESVRAYHEPYDPETGEIL